MIVGSWPCKVSSKIHINGRHVSEPVREDKGKTTATKPEDEKDLKRARVVLSKGCEVVESGYSRLIGAAAKVTDRGENLGNPSRVNRVSKTEQHYPSRVSQVGRVSQVSQNSSMDRRADRVNWVSWVGNTERKIGGSSWVANMESWVMENSANTESRVTENSTNTKSRVTHNSANMESWVTENSTNMENWVMQDSGGRKPEEGKGAAPSKRPAPWWCPRGITKTQKHRLQKMHQRELTEKKEEDERDYWFNRLCPMTKPKQTWREKWIAKEENGSSGDSSGEEEVEVTSAKGDSNSGSGNANPESGNHNSGGKEDRREEEPTRMDVNMVFMILLEFHAPMEDITELALGAKCAMFKKPENPGTHINPLFIQGHLDGTPIGHMLMDGGTSINILPLSLFKKLDHIEGDLKCTNLSLSGFAGDPTEAKGIIFKELTVGSKTKPTAFFVVGVKGCYNVLLRQDWIHTNECVPSTLHQCVIQWIDDEVQLVQADEDVCITMTECQVDIQGGKMKCLTGKDLMGYDYISVSKDGFVPISVKPAISATRLAHDLV
jgi:hypothetical protein